MIEELSTPLGREVYASCFPSIIEFCCLLEQYDFIGAANSLDHTRSLVDEWCGSAINDAEMKDLYVVHRLIKMLTCYSEYWCLLMAGNNAGSWYLLQDTLDALRAIKRFSRINITCIERQLVGLESTYPYRLFASIGGIVDYTECSICGLDIESLDCPHRMGEMYSGSVAVGIIKEFRLKHVALVTNPVDKRCVMHLKDRDYQYPVLDCIRVLLECGKARIGCIVGFEWSTRDTVIDSTSEGDPQHEHSDAQQSAEQKNHVEIVFDTRSLADCFLTR